MNLLLTIIQILLAAHTTAGAVWKFSHSPAETMPSLAAIPQDIWLGMSGLEILIAVLLVLPIFKKSWHKLAATGALAIAFEMISFCAIHVSSGSREAGPMLYWLIVASVSGFVFYGRFARSH